MHKPWAVHMSDTKARMPPEDAPGQSRNPIQTLPQAKQGGLSVDNYCKGLDYFSNSRQPCLQHGPASRPFLKVSI